MLLKDINTETANDNKLIYNNDYYRHVFKKTEKIVAATLYLLETVPAPKRQNKLLSDIEQIAHQTHDLTLASLVWDPFSAKPTLQSLTHSYISLTSKLSLGQAINLLPPDLVPILDAEIEGVLRSLSKFTKDTKPKDSALIKNRDHLTALTATAFTPGENKSLPTLSPTPNQKPKKDQNPTATSLPRQNRRLQIIDVLRAKSPASVKDIADSITGCSAKTVQRELGNLIKDNLVIKKGERRWSKYTLS